MRPSSLATIATFIAHSWAASAGKMNKRGSSSVDAIAFENVGFSGSYLDVQSLSDIYSDSCSCSLSSTSTKFSGTNAPLDEELSVHFRGPLTLLSFGSYVSTDSSSGTWERLSYYDAESQTADNVTFLTSAGETSPCLGKALTYASNNGTGAADSSTVLKADNLIASDEEYVIFSNVSCPASGSSKACGVYRDGIPAYHGFYGATKMFLFEFQMPTAASETDYNYNMPAIWFLNAKIPRTSEYASNSSCSCWNSGCGEIDIFEVMNSTQSARLYSTIHTYRNTDSINTGLQAYAYFDRDTKNTMKGGVVFGTNGTITVFMSDDMEASSSISATNVSSWISSSEMAVDNLETLAASTSTSSSKKSNGCVAAPKSWIAATMSVLFSLFMYI